MLRVYKAKLYGHNCEVTDGWYIVIDENDFEAEFIRGNALLEIAEKHKRWFSWLDRDFGLTTNPRAIGREAEYLCSKFSGTFMDNENCYCLSGGDRFYILAGSGSVDNLYIEFAFYMDGLKFVYGSGAVSVYRNSGHAYVDIVLCVDDSDVLLGVFLNGGAKVSVLDMLSATVCDQRVKAFVAKYMMINSELYEQSFMVGLLKEG